jgi:hypothetical protein
MNTALLAVVGGEAAVLMWGAFGIITVLLLLWMFYMMTFRTEDWLRLVKNEQERKAEAHKRRGQMLKGGFFVVRILWRIFGKR